MKAIGIGIAAILGLLALVMGESEAKAEPAPPKPPPPTPPKPYTGACLLDAGMPDAVKKVVQDILASKEMDAYDVKNAADMMEKNGYPMAAGCLRAYSLELLAKYGERKPGPAPGPGPAPKPTTGPTCSDLKARYVKLSSDAMRLGAESVTAIADAYNKAAREGREITKDEKAEAQWKSERLLTDSKDRAAEATAVKNQMKARGCPAP